MAGTYFGYAERNVENQIDWSEVGKDMSKMLNDEARLREAKKKAIDDASREFGKVLDDAPMGKHTGINDFILDGTNSTQQMRLLQDRLLKSGQLKPRDYNIQRQNLNDGWDATLSVITDANAKFDEIAKRHENKESAYQEFWEAGLAQGFGNFSETGLYINPTNYTMSVGKKVKNEKTGMMELSKNPNDHQSLSQMRSRLDNRINRFDPITGLTQGVQALGKEVALLQAAGGIQLVNDITKRKMLDPDSAKIVGIYEKAENTFIDSLMTSPTQVGSVLTDFVGLNPETKLAYDFTLDPKEAEADPNKILMVADPSNPSSGRLVPQPSDKQKQVAKEALRNQFRIMLDKDIQYQQKQVQYAPQYVYAAGAGKKTAVDKANMLGKLYYGDDAEIKAALQSFGMDGVTSIYRNADTVDSNGEPKRGDVVITMDDGRVIPISFYGDDGTLLSQEDFIKSAARLTGIENVEEGLESGDYVKGRPYNPSGKGEYKVTRPGQVNPVQEFADYIDNTITPDLLVSDHESKTVAALSPVLASLGFTVKGTGTFGDYITITSPGVPATKNSPAQASQSIEINIDSLEGEKKTAALKTISEFIKTNTGMVTMGKLKMSGKY